MTNESVDDYLKRVREERQERLTRAEQWYWIAKKWETPSKTHAERVKAACWACPEVTSWGRFRRVGFYLWNEFFTTYWTWDMKTWEGKFKWKQTIFKKRDWGFVWSRVKWHWSNGPMEFDRNYV